MGIEEVMENATIHLPQPVSLEEFEGILEYIAKKLPANVNYQPSYFMNFYQRGNGEGISKQRGTVNVSGQIRSHREDMAFDSFQTNPSQADTSMIASLTFAVVPGWDLEDYRPETIKLRENIRKLISTYNLHM